MIVKKYQFYIPMTGYNHICVICTKTGALRIIHQNQNTKNHLFITFLKVKYPVVSPYSCSNTQHLVTIMKPSCLVLGICWGRAGCGTTASSAPKVQAVDESVDLMKLSPIVGVYMHISSPRQVQFRDGTCSLSALPDCFGRIILLYRLKLLYFW